VGIAYMPVAGELFVGALGHGARVNGRPVHLSQVGVLSQAAISHGGLQQFTSNGQGDLLLRLGEHTYTQRGFADFDGYRQLLLGRVDAMIDPGVKPFDICPAAVLVREAGGRFTDLSGADSIYGGSGLASNGQVHDALLSLLQR
jgi:histidinol-phosphatase